MARTTATEVKQIIDTSLEDAEVTNFINIAYNMVNDILTTSLFSATQLEEIERWLSAHLITITKERMGETEKVGEASIKYIGKYGMGFESTPYGQMVLNLDTSGEFAKTGKKRARIRAITSFDDE